jgi:ABC-type nitrate/sulfonate/bicarbonate transport system substrate-binding protein
VIIKASAGDVPELQNFLYTGIAIGKEYAEKNADGFRRWIKAANRADALMRKDKAAAITHLRKDFPRMEPAVLALAMREIVPAPSGDGVMNEQMMQKHLDFLQDTGQISSKLSAKERLLRTNARIAK